VARIKRTQATSLATIVQIKRDDERDIIYSSLSSAVDRYSEGVYVFWEIHFQGLMIEWTIVVLAYAVFFAYIIKQQKDERHK
jgi:hypothetical protein